MRRVRVAFLAGDRGDVDDPAVLVLDHVRHDGAADQVGRDQVDLDDAAPDVGRQLPGRAVAAGDAGVVDEDVDLLGRRRRALGRARRPRASLVSSTASAMHLAGRAERGLGLGELAGVGVPQRHRRARGQHALGDGVADALRAAGDDCDAALQIDLVHERRSSTASPLSVVAASGASRQSAMYWRMMSAKSRSARRPRRARAPRSRRAASWRRCRRWSRRARSGRARARPGRPPPRARRASARPSR